MKKLALSFTIIFILFGCTKQVKEYNRAEENNDALFQYSTKVDLSKGVYDGNLLISQILSKGNFGIGTFNGINGEMVIKDGICYRANYQGVIEKVDESEKTPFIMTKFFKADTSFTITGGLTLDSLKTELDKIFNLKNKLSAIRITGNFDKVTTRSVAKQNKPYPELTEVIKSQNIFEKENVGGTVVGFWTPEKLDNVNFPGYHFHFLDNDLSIGGHLLNCNTNNITIEIDYTNEVDLVLL